MIIVQLIRETKTRTGMTVKARLDKKIYEKGIKVSALELKNLNMIPNKFHGEWNYTIRPQSM